MAEPKVPQHLIDDKSADLTDVDHRRLARVGCSLARARTLRDWWFRKNTAWQTCDGTELARIGDRPAVDNPESDHRVHPELFHLTAAPPLWADTEANWGFFDEAEIDGQARPIMGLFQQTLFDEPRAYFAERDPDRQLSRWQEDLRAFVLKYLIRLTGFYETSPYVDPSQRAVDAWLRPFSLRAPQEERRRGFGFSQIYYKRHDTGRVGKFHDVDRSRVDLRTLHNSGIEESPSEVEYDWIVVGIRINDLHLRHPAVDWLSLSINDEVLAVLSPDFITDVKEHPGPGGRFGFGYAVLEDPPDEGPTIVWIRPRFGFELNEFVVLDTGRVLARAAMVTEKLPRLMALNTLKLGRSIADRASMGFFSPTMAWSQQMFEAAAPGMVRTIVDFAGLTSARFDPVNLVSAAANAVGVASVLGVSTDDLLRCLLADFVRSQFSTIIASRGVWRAVREWEHGTIPDWVPSA